MNIKILNTLCLIIALFFILPFSYSQSCNTSKVPGAAANYLFNNNLNDASASDFDLTGTAAYNGTDKIEGSHSLNLVGSSNVIENTTAELYTSTFTERTVSVFVKATDPSNGIKNQYIVEEGSRNNSVGIRFEPNGNLVVDMVMAGTNRFLRFTEFPDDDQWHHIAYTFDGTNQLFTLYVDGYPVESRLSASSQALPNIEVTNAQGIGLSIGNNNGNTISDTNAGPGVLPFDGLIDDIAFYESVLTPKQIYDIATCGGADYLLDLTPMNCPPLLFTSTEVHAVGYNQKDQRIWGSHASGQLLVLSQLSDNSIQFKLIGPIKDLPTFNYSVGDVHNGKLYLTGTNSNLIQVVDVDQNSPDYLSFLYSIPLNANTGVADFAISPVDGKAYGIFDRGSATSPFDGNLIQIDLTPNPPAGVDNRNVLGPTGVRVLAETAGKNSPYSVVYFDKDRFFYASNDITGQIFRLDLRTDPGADYDETKTVEFENPGLFNSTDVAFCTSATIAIDLGDAPESYKTLLKDNGPRHHIVGFDSPIEFSTDFPNLMLGTKIDRETDGIPSENADGDSKETTVDSDEGGDEDALDTSSFINEGSGNSINLTVTNTTGANAYLSAWIDFNLDGDFADSGEQIANDQIVPNNANTANINYDKNKIQMDGTTYSRFRICEAAGTCNTFTGYVESGEVEDYSITFTGNDVFLLPVELISFTAETLGVDAILKWATATELNNEKFELQYSLDGLNFEKFAEVAGQGTTREISKYSYKHVGIGSTGVEQVFYRLRQVDYDGSSSFSEIQVAVFASINELVVYPNPSQQGEQVVITGTERLGNYKVFNMKGSLEYVGGVKNSKSITFSTASLSSGIYFVVLENGGKVKIVVN